MNLTDANLQPAPCLPCCAANVPSVCYFTLPPPIGASPYANINVATDVIANQTNNCAGYITSATYVGFTAEANSSAVTLNAAGNVATTGMPMYFWAGLTAGTSEVLSMAYALSGGFAGVIAASVYDATGNIVQNFSSTTNGNPFVTSALSAGAYEIEFAASALLGLDETLFANVATTSNQAMTPCVVRAAYGNVPDYLVCT